VSGRVALNVPLDTFVAGGFGRLTIPERAWPGSCNPLSNFTLLNFSGMAEDRIVKFCARVRRLAREVISLVVTNCPQNGHGQGHVTS